MATKVKGEDVILYVLDDGSYKPVACSVSCEFTSTADWVEVTTAGTGVWKSKDYQALDWKVRCDNVIILDDTSTKAVLFLLLQTQHNFLKMLMQFTIQDSAGNAKTITGQVLIPSIVFSGAVDDFARYQVEFEGDGEPIITDGLTTNITITLRAQGQDGTTGSIDSATLVDAFDNETELLSVPLTTTAFPGFNTITAEVPSGVYKLRITVTTSALGPAMESHTLSHDADPGSIEHPGPAGSTSFYDDPEPIFDFSVDRTITLVTGAS